MKTLTKISLFVIGAMMVAILVSSCSAGNAASRHNHKASGSQVF